MIVSIPHPALSKRAGEVTKIDKKIREVIRRLKSDLEGARRPKGVGLAAPQIGISLRIFVTKPDTDSPIRVFINPEILWKSSTLSEILQPKKNKERDADEQEKRLEGCLSVPNVWGYLKRSDKVRLKYMDENGKIHEEEFTGFMATIVQHETDHLNGVLFTQRVLEQDRKLYEIEKDSEGKEKLVEIEI